MGIGLHNTLFFFQKLRNVQFFSRTKKQEGEKEKKEIVTEGAQKIKKQETNFVSVQI